MAFLGRIFGFFSNISPLLEKIKTGQALLSSFFKELALVI